MNTCSYTDILYYFNFILNLLTQVYHTYVTFETITDEPIFRIKVENDRNRFDVVH